MGIAVFCWRRTMRTSGPHTVLRPLNVEHQDKLHRTQNGNRTQKTTAQRLPVNSDTQTLKSAHGANFKFEKIYTHTHARTCRSNAHCRTPNVRDSLAHTHTHTHTQFVVNCNSLRKNVTTFEGVCFCEGTQQTNSSDPPKRVFRKG